MKNADVVELVDTLASGASESNLVWVRVPPSARSFVSSETIQNNAQNRRTYLFIHNNNKKDTL